MLRINLYGIAGSLTCAYFSLKKVSSLIPICEKLITIAETCSKNREQLTNSVLFLTHKWFYSLLHSFHYIPNPTLPTCDDEYNLAKECLMIENVFLKITNAFLAITTGLLVHKIISEPNFWTLKITNQEHQGQGYTICRYWLLGMIPSAAFYYNRTQVENS